MLVLIRWHSRNVVVPLSQLTGADADECTVEAIKVGSSLPSVWLMSKT